MFTEAAGPNVRGEEEVRATVNVSGGSTTRSSTKSMIIDFGPVSPVENVTLVVTPRKSAFSAVDVLVVTLKRKLKSIISL